MAWNPEQYEKFDDERLRPWRDLCARLRHPDPRLIVDMGCGNGLSTLELAAQHPQARVVGADLSQEMLGRAREHDAEGRVEWMHGDAADFDVSTLGCPDIITSNALLQWVPGHDALLAAWAHTLAPGGVLAMQVPGNFDSPSHALMREVAGASPWAKTLLPRLRHHNPVDTPTGYAQTLADAGLTDLDCWETTYTHLLPGTDEHPVLAWVRGTGLRPLLGVLDPDDEEQLLADYASALESAYPRTSLGVAFEFRRVFAVGRSPERDC